MSDESTKDRSPRSPVVLLNKCIEVTGKLHGECRRNPVEAITAAKAMGFPSVHGGVATLLASLREYGLIDRPQGKVVVTALAVKILHPTSDDQKRQAIQESALLPKVFRTLLKDFGDCSPTVIESHLVQAGFTPDRASQVAKVFIGNKAFAELEAGSNMDVMELDEDEDDPKGNARGDVGGSQLALPLARQLPNTGAARSAGSQSSLTPAAGNSFSFKGEMLAQYHIPLGGNQAYLAFTGEELVPEDFEALIEYVELFKKQFERKLKSGPPKAVPEVASVPPPSNPTADFFDQDGKPL